MVPPLHPCFVYLDKLLSLRRKGPFAGAMLKLFAILLLFVEFSSQQKNPLNDFCRRFGHQATVVDQKLFIDGGQVDWNPISQNDQNYTSELEILQSSEAQTEPVN